MNNKKLEELKRQVEAVTGLRTPKTIVTPIRSLVLPAPQPRLPGVLPAPNSFGGTFGGGVIPGDSVEKIAKIIPCGLRPWRPGSSILIALLRIDMDPGHGHLLKASSVFDLIDYCGDEWLPATAAEGCAFVEASAEYPVNDWLPLTHERGLNEYIVAAGSRVETVAQYREDEPPEVAVRAASFWFDPHAGRSLGWQPIARRRRVPRPGHWLVVRPA